MIYLGYARKVSLFPVFLLNLSQHSGHLWLGTQLWVYHNCKMIRLLLPDIGSETFQNAQSGLKHMRTTNKPKGGVKSQT